MNATRDIAMLGAGAALMYLMDPERGRRRRALVKDQMVHARHELEEAAGKTARDVANRARGAVAEVKSGHLPAPPDVTQENWSPAARLLLGVGGGALAMYGLGRNDVIGAALGAAGLGVLLRAATNVEGAALVGATSEPTIRVQKSLTIAAPPERVFAFWADFRNFPNVMSHVREVRDLGGGRSRWIVDGPAGAPVEWDAELTEFEADRTIAWRSLPDSLVNTQGRVRFIPLADGGTRIDVHLQYLPPAGAIGHWVAKVFGADPKKQIDDDMVRLKTAIEQGVLPRDAAARTREEATQSAR